MILHLQVNKKARIQKIIIMSMLSDKNKLNAFFFSFRDEMVQMFFDDHETISNDGNEVFQNVLHFKLYIIHFTGNFPHMFGELDVHIY